eukprot:6178811-Pleurochrysis_carterae.AAC.1
MEAGVAIVGGDKNVGALPATPLFQTPTRLVESATAFQRRAKLDGEIIKMQDLDAGVTDQELKGPMPKSWYVVIGGPFEGVRFGNYDREIRQDVDCMRFAVLTDQTQASLTKLRRLDGCARRANNESAMHANSSRQHRRHLRSRHVRSLLRVSAPVKPAAAMTAANHYESNGDKDCRSSALPGG